jgi:hypothetical protein
MFGTSLSQQSRTLVAVALLAVFCALAAPAMADEPTTADTIPTIYGVSYSVTVKGKAQANGTFTMKFTPYQEEGVTFTVNVAQRMPAKKIAADIAKELTIATGARFKVKQNGGKVIVKKASKKKSPNFNIEIVSQKLTGVSLMIGK